MFAGVLEEPWWLLLAPIFLILFYKACWRQSEVLTSAWGFLCPPIEPSHMQGEKRKFQFWRFAVLCTGLGCALAILVKPTWPAQIRVLCLQARPLVQQSKEETEEWVQSLRQKIETQVKATQPKNNIGEFIFIHPEGREFKSIHLLKATLKNSDFSSSSLPENFINTTGPKLIASQWLPVKSSPAALSNYSSASSPAALSGYSSASSPLASVLYHPQKKIGDVQITTLPQKKALILGFTKATTIAQIRYAGQTWPIAPKQREGAEAMLLPWKSGGLEFLNASGEILEVLDGSDAPSASITLHSTVPLAEALQKAVSEWKLFEARELNLQNTQSRSIPTLNASPVWNFVPDTAEDTISLPTGLPFILQTTSLLRDPIRHIGMDWPIEQLPKVAFKSDLYRLVGIQGYPVVRWRDESKKIMELTLPPELKINQPFWELLLEATFPTPQVFWESSKENLEPFSTSQTRQAWSSNAQLILLALMTICFYCSWRWEKLIK
jgi:hypothetical protein